VTAGRVSESLASDRDETPSYPRYGNVHDGLMHPAFPRGSRYVGVGVGIVVGMVVDGSGGVTMVVGRSVCGDGSGSGGVAVTMGVAGVGAAGGETVPVSDGGMGTGILTPGRGVPGAAVVGAGDPAGAGSVTGVVTGTAVTGTEVPDIFWTTPGVITDPVCPGDAGTGCAVPGIPADSLPAPSPAI